MLSEYKIAEIFVMADDFCKVFNETLRRRGLMKVNPDRKRSCHRPNRMFDAEIIVIMIMFRSSSHKCLKHFYLQEICGRCRHLFPRTVSYNRFTELEKSVIVPFVIFVKKCLLGKCTGISFVDSTLLRVCRNQRGFQGDRPTGQVFHGMVYGFKLHLISNEKGELLNFMITPGDVDDREPLEYKAFVDFIYRKLVGDKGCIGKDLFSKLFIDGTQLITKLKNNMKGGLRSMYDRILLRKLAIIETINEELKNITQIEHSRHRSFQNFIINLIGGMAAYCLFPKKPMINPERIFDNQLTLF